MKLTVTRLPAASAQLLLDLRHMAVIADAVRRQALARFREQDVLLQRAAGAGDARLRIDDDAVGHDQLGLGQRQKREQHGGGIAARTGDEARGLDLLRVVLGQPVDGLLEKLRRAMLAAIPFGIDGGVA